MNRRNFLKLSAGAVAVAGSPAVLVESIAPVYAHTEVSAVVHSGPSVIATGQIPKLLQEGIRAVFEQEMANMDLKYESIFRRAA